jgi:hypothetical protein
VRRPVWSVRTANPSRSAARKAEGSGAQVGPVLTRPVWHAAAISI